MNADIVTLTDQVLNDVSGFLTERGAYGYEGAGLIACIPADSGWISSRLVIPDQRAQRKTGGCSVEVTQRGKDELLTSLLSSERYLLRVHSHPGEAFHSTTDDRNPALTHQGALSIVVPFFGLGLQRGLDACAIYRLVDAQWQELPAGRERETWVIHR
jgi:hypothetical protein